MTTKQQVKQVLELALSMAKDRALEPFMGVKFISAKQNSYATWFPLEINGDKTAALYLTGGGEWVVEPISHKAHGELSGEWEGFDLTEFMAMNCPEFDQDDY